MAKSLAKCLIILLFPLQALAWDKGDTARELAWQGLNVVDWGQTRYIVKHPDSYNEINPLLGDHPDISTVNVYFIGWGASHYLISRALPPKWRKVWQASTIGITASFVAHNHSIGLRMEF